MWPRQEAKKLKVPRPSADPNCGEWPAASLGLIETRQRKFSAKPSPERTRRATVLAAGGQESRKYKYRVLVLRASCLLLVMRSRNQQLSAPFSSPDLSEISDGPQLVPVDVERDIISLHFLSFFYRNCSSRSALEQQRSGAFRNISPPFCKFPFNLPLCSSLLHPHFHPRLFRFASPSPLPLSVLPLPTIPPTAMSAATAGYRTIGTPAPGPTDSPPAPSDMPASSNSTTDRVQAVARGAGAAAVGAKDAVAQLITAPMPDVNLYTEPLNPAAQLTLKDRAQLVMESCRPWSEFADLKAFDAPAASEAKLRVAHNVEVFFYNYLVVGMGFLALFAFFHPIRALLLALTVTTAVGLYILFPEDYTLNDNFSVTKPMKHVFMAVLALLVLTVGHVFALLFWVALTVVPLVLVHAFLREHSAAAVPSSI